MFRTYVFLAALLVFGASACAKPKTGCALEVESFKTWSASFCETPQAEGLLIPEDFALVTAKAKNVYNHAGLDVFVTPQGMQLPSFGNARIRPLTEENWQKWVRTRGAMVLPGESLTATLSITPDTPMTEVASAIQFISKENVKTISLRYKHNMKELKKDVTPLEIQLFGDNESVVASQRKALKDTIGQCEALDKPLRARARCEDRLKEVATAMTTCGCSTGAKSLKSYFLGGLNETQIGTVPLTIDDKGKSFPMKGLWKDHAEKMLLSKKRSFSL